MKCRECAGNAGHHEPECEWGRDIAVRYCAVANKIAAFEGTGEVDRLREAYDQLAELIAWASAYGASRQK